MADGSILRLNSLSKSFGGLKAVDQVSLDVPRESIFGLIGPNGSGKTTLFNCVLGVLHPDSGSVWYSGKRIDGLAPFRIARLGIGRTFQQVRLFRELTIMENMAIAAMGAGLREWKQRAQSILDDLGILTKIDEDRALNLSVGQQKLLSLAMSLLVDSELIMLDEPCAGINPSIVSVMKKMFETYKQQGKTFIIIEHNIPFIMDTCDRIAVLHLGHKLAEGTPASIGSDRNVLKAYLGRKHTVEGEDVSSH